MNEMLKAVIEIERLKEEYKLSALEVFVLQILKSAELEGQNYDSMLEYFKNHRPNPEDMVADFSKSWGNA